MKNQQIRKSHRNLVVVSSGIEVRILLACGSNGLSHKYVRPFQPEILFGDSEMCW
jgi:hypothetical protein